MEHENNKWISVASEVMQAFIPHCSVEAENSKTLHTLTFGKDQSEAISVSKLNE